jgi:mRNA-degrading endonuclease toxin of MazEF toxin-antitoxin module
MISFRNAEAFSRPVLILKGFSRRVCLIVGEKNGTAIISQIRLIDTRRLEPHITTIDKETFERIRKAVKDIL